MNYNSAKSSNTDLKDLMLSMGYHESPSWVELTECLWFYPEGAEYYIEVIKVKGTLPFPQKLREPGTYYVYNPDKRPITHRLLGKPALGPSPPHDALFVFILS
jgi:hypothetical protein